jgi:hypothetical protein
LNYTSTCMHNVHSVSFVLAHCDLLLNTFVCEQEVLLHISFSYCCSLKFESSTLCTNTCYIQLSNKLQSQCLLFITFILDDKHGLSLGMLMHVKCIHELCSFAIYSNTFAYYEMLYSCFALIYGDFPLIPFH